MSDLTVQPNQIPVSKETLKILLTIACTEVPFTFNGKTFIQIGGLSMGSCLAPLMAEFALHMIEDSFTAPRLFLRYVDDCLALFSDEQEAEDFLKEMNSQHPSLQFTIEKEHNNQINFLDMTVYHSNKTLHTKWHIKPTNTFLYTHFSSASPPSYKKNAIRALYTRSQKLTTETENKIEARQLVKNIFRKNGYSDSYIERIFSETDQSNSRDHNIQDKKKIYWKLPYTTSTYAEIKNKIQSLNKILKNTTIKPAFKTFKTQNLCPNKDKIEQNELSSIVYKYTCEQCQHCYIGETRRQLQKRIKEHVKGNPPSEISMHIHPPKKENFRVLFRTKYTKTAETFIIKQYLSENRPLMNNQRTSDFLLLF